MADKSSDTALETLCPLCWGKSGQKDRTAGWVDCPKCDGAGYLPTEFGAKIVALMRHQFKAVSSEISASSIQ